MDLCRYTAVIGNGLTFAVVRQRPKSSQMLLNNLFCDLPITFFAQTRFQGHFDQGTVSAWQRHGESVR